MSAQIDASLVIDKLTLQIGNLSKDLAMTQALAESQGEVITQQASSLERQVEVINQLNARLEEMPVEGEVIHEQAE